MVENEEKRRKLKLDDYGLEPLEDTVLKKVAKVVCPVIFLFGIYIILNGHLSPGGGFSGGAVIGAGMILYAASFGFPRTQRFFNEKIYVIVKVTALLLYGLIALHFFYTGANGLEHLFPAGGARGYFKRGDHPAHQYLRGDRGGMYNLCILCIVPERGAVRWEAI